MASLTICVCGSSAGGTEIEAVDALLDRRLLHEVVLSWTRVHAHSLVLLKVESWFACCTVSIIWPCALKTVGMTR